MRRTTFITAQITLLVITILYGCSPTPVLTSTDSVSVEDETTPAPSVMPSSTAEHVTLLQTMVGHSQSVLDVAFSARGEFLVSSGRDMNIKVWDVKRGVEVGTFQMRSVDMADIDIAIESNLLASGEAIWDLDTFQEIHVLERGSRYPADVAFSPDGATLAVGLFEKQITLWDVMSGQPVYTFDQQEENRTKSMDFSPDGALLAVGVVNGTVRLLDIASGNLVNTLAYRGETDIHDVVFSPDGNYLATGGRITAAILWDIPSWEVAKTFRLSDNLIKMDFSPDGKTLATAGGFGYEVRLWDIESGNLVHSLPHDAQLTSLAFSPGGEMLAVGSSDNTIYLWGIPTGP